MDNRRLGERTRRSYHDCAAHKPECPVHDHPENPASCMCAHPQAGSPVSDERMALDESQVRSMMDMLKLSRAQAEAFLRIAEVPRLESEPWAYCVCLTPPVLHGEGHAQCDNCHVALAIANGRTCAGYRPHPAPQAEPAQRAISDNVRAAIDRLCEDSIVDNNEEDAAHKDAALVRSWLRSNPVASEGATTSDDVKALIAEARQTCARMEAADFELSLRILVADLADALERASSPSVTLDELTIAKLQAIKPRKPDDCLEVPQKHREAVAFGWNAVVQEIRIALADVLASRGGEQ